MFAWADFNGLLVIWTYQFMKSSAEIRQMFLNYFRDRGHEVVPSATLVPSNDSTLLFTNAGMVPFKDVFLGHEQRGYLRAASSQRCVRAGGKHNDLENVGYTARHHTFFEMLGNFSFGDYFKKDAIRLAWDFLIEEAGLPEQRLWVTVYEEDDESADIWLRQIGVDPERFSRIGDKPGGRRYESDNFWSMGDTGPCGPCTEIFYDHGPQCQGGPPGTEEGDGDRYIEIWNLVFIQFNRDETGQMYPLPKPSVDTGMGLERLAAVLQGVHENYETDLFINLIQAAAGVIGVKNRQQKSLRVIADHIRSCSYLIVDGVLPSNDGRGYVLRRIIRRAIRHGKQLGAKGPFFYKLVGPLCHEMGDAYPELNAARIQVEQVLQQEERRFAEALEQGIKILEQDIHGMSSGDIPGATIFRLYDTYGFPVDLMADIARERNLGMDMEGFEACMDEQRQRARAAGSFKADYNKAVSADMKTDFTGYDHFDGASEITVLIYEGQATSQLKCGQEGSVVLNETPFYAESGGQVGDRGTIATASALFEVLDTRKQVNSIVHIGKLQQGELHVGERVKLVIDRKRRRSITLNHSATHLLHAALRQVLGGHVTQRGSLVAPDHLRFDFSHPEPVRPDELCTVERMVNQQIRCNHEARTRLMMLDDAIAEGAMALFGEKYDDEVRVLSLGDFSLELCGGTHVARTGDIGFFKLTQESGIAAGVRRIEAVTGDTALDVIYRTEAELDRVSSIVKGPRHDIANSVRSMMERLRVVDKELEQIKSVLASSRGNDMADRATETAGIRVLAETLDNADMKMLRETVDQLKDRLGTAAIVLAGVEKGKVRLIAGVSKDASKRIPAGELVNMVAEQVGGRGGGRPDMAQGGGSDVNALPEALRSVAGWVERRLIGEPVL